MKSPFYQILILAAAACPLQAIEPPVEAQPIPPRNVPADKGESAPKAVPVVPEVGEPGLAPIPVPAVDERPYIGVILHPVPEILAGHLKLADGEGLVIEDLVAGGPAELAGLAVNDVITQVGGEVVGSSMEVRKKVDQHKVGDEVKLGVIHNGERSEVSVTLGAAPDMLPGIPNADMAFGGADDLLGLLGNLPEEQADLMRKAMEQQIQGFGQLNNGGGVPDNWQKDLLKRIERGMKAGGEGLDFGELKAEASARLFDDQGSIEMKGVDGNKEVKVFDKEGNLVWEGPYDTEQDKAAVPDDIRERIDQVDLNMGFGGTKLELRVGPRRFRPLDEVAPNEQGE